ncbi:MAG: hypothetical protein QNL04_03510 [SAR324 cluster bacterium]|nr:hypothetical protein [SAR324 cluster bacterium]
MKNHISYISRGSTDRFWDGYNAMDYFIDNKKALEGLVNNESYVTTKRKGRVRFYHEVLAIHPGDQCENPEVTMKEFAYEYLNRRCPEGLAYFKLHLGDGKKPHHIHFLISGNKLASSRAMTLKKAVYARVKIEMQQYQMKKYPEMKHSIVNLDGKGPKRDFVPVEENPVRLRLLLEGKDLKKEPKLLVREIVKQVLSRSLDVEMIKQSLGKEKLKLFRRREVLWIKDLNIEPPLRFKISQLGLEGTLEQMLQRVLPVEQRKQSLKRVRQTRETQKQSVELNQRQVQLEKLRIERRLQLNPNDDQAKKALLKLREIEDQRLKASIRK